MSLPPESLVLLLQLAAVILGLALIGSTVGPLLDRLWDMTIGKVRERFERRRDKARIVRRLFPHTDHKQLTWIRDLLPGPQWRRDNPKGTLAETATVVLDRQGSATLYCVDSEVRFALKWRLALRRWRESRASKQAIDHKVKGLSREERRPLWLFWQKDAMVTETALTRLNRALVTLESKGIISTIRKKNSFTRIGIKLKSASIKPVEKHILRGKKVARQHVYVSEASAEDKERSRG